MAFCAFGLFGLSGFILWLKALFYSNDGEIEAHKLI
jgi:hypothetical protein